MASGRYEIGRWAFDVDEAITFQIVVLSNLFARPFCANVGRHAKINLNEWHVILALARHPALNQVEIARCTGLRRLTVSRAVRRLISNGWALGQRDEADGRTNRLFLTPVGASVCAKAFPLLKLREAMVGAGLKAADLRAFKRILIKITGDVRDWADVA